MNISNDDINRLSDVINKIGKSLDNIMNDLSPNIDKFIQMLESTFELHADIRRDDDGYIVFMVKDGVKTNINISPEGLDDISSLLKAIENYKQPSND